MILEWSVPQLYFSDCWQSSTFCYLCLRTLFSFHESPNCIFSPFSHECVFLSY